MCIYIFVFVCMYTNVSMYYPCMFITRGRIIRKSSEKRIIDSLTILANIIFRTKVIFYSPLDNRRTCIFFSFRSVEQFLLQSSGGIKQHSQVENGFLNIFFLTLNILKINKNGQIELYSGCQ